MSCCNDEIYLAVIRHQVYPTPNRKYVSDTFGVSIRVRHNLVLQVEKDHFCDVRLGLSIPCNKISNGGGRGGRRRGERRRDYGEVI